MLSRLQTVMMSLHSWCYRKGNIKNKYFIVRIVKYILVVINFVLYCNIWSFHFDIFFCFEAVKIAVKKECRFFWRWIFVRRVVAVTYCRRPFARTWSRTSCNGTGWRKNYFSILNFFVSALWVWARFRRQWKFAKNEVCKATSSLSLMLV